MICFPWPSIILTRERVFTLPQSLIYSWLSCEYKVITPFIILNFDFNYFLSRYILIKFVTTKLSINHISHIKYYACKTPHVYTWFPRIGSYVRNCVDGIRNELISSRRCQLRNLDVSRKGDAAILDSPQALWFRNCTRCIPIMMYAIHPL